MQKHEIVQNLRRLSTVIEEDDPEVAAETLDMLGEEFTEALDQAIILLSEGPGDDEDEIEVEEDTDDEFDDDEEIENEEEE